MKCCICGTVKNCGKYLDNVFKNMEIIGSLFEDFDIVLFYDNSTDNTLNILKDYQKQNKNFFLYINKNEISKLRTVRLAYARNKCIEYVFSSSKNYDFFIMMDCDDVCSTKIKIDVLKTKLKIDTWDCLTFNKNDYYDIWALSKYPYLISFFHRKQNLYYEIKSNIENLLKNLEKDELLQCWSAFNGFGIYRKEKFRNCFYNGIFNFHLFPKNLIKHEIKDDNIKFLLYEKENIEDCEHRSFHVQSILKNNAKIVISPDTLFE
jgi:hypothetical protein